MQREKKAILLTNAIFTFDNDSVRVIEGKDEEELNKGVEAFSRVGWEIDGERGKHIPTVAAVTGLEFHILTQQMKYPNPLIKFPPTLSEYAMYCVIRDGRTVQSDLGEITAMQGDKWFIGGIGYTANQLKEVWVHG